MAATTLIETHYKMRDDILAGSCRERDPQFACRRWLDAGRHVVVFGQ
jgi:hypothetical protein